MQTHALFSAALLLMGAPCSPATDTQDSEPLEPPGDGEYTPTLPNDRPDSEPVWATVVEPFELTSPAGHQIYGQLRRPDPSEYPGLSFAAVVRVPGGINPGRQEVMTQELISAAEAGMVVVCFNAEGRMDTQTCSDPSDDSTCTDLRSEGDEDYNGPTNQDTLAEVVHFTQTLEYVIPDNVGLWTQSYGITMAAGAIARHPDLGLEYLVDGEGPPNSFVTCQEPWALFADESHGNRDKFETVQDILGHYSTARDPSPDTLAFWYEREAIRHIGAFDGRYLRLQAEWDHTQPPASEDQLAWFEADDAIWWRGKHTVDIVNAAVSGGVPWVRVNLENNHNSENATYDRDTPPNWLTGQLSDAHYAVGAVLEMANAEAL
jgi:hypothetical protein